MKLKLASVTTDGPQVTEEKLAVFKGPDPFSTFLTNKNYAVVLTTAKLFVTLLSRSRTVLLTVDALAACQPRRGVLLRSGEECGNTRYGPVASSEEVTVRRRWPMLHSTTNTNSSGVPPSTALVVVWGGSPPKLTETEVPIQGRFDETNPYGCGQPKRLDDSQRSKPALDRSLARWCQNEVTTHQPS